MDIYSCQIKIENPQKVLQMQTVKGPAVMLIQQFYSLAEQIIKTKEPLKITLSRKVSIWDQFDNKTIEREYSVSFANNPYCYETEKEEENEI